MHEVLQSARLSVCPLTYLKNHTSKHRETYCTEAVAWSSCNTICTSCFVDDVTFSHNGAQWATIKHDVVSSSSLDGGTVKKLLSTIAGLLLLLS